MYTYNLSISSSGIPPTMNSLGGSVIPGSRRENRGVEDG